jgi:alkane 1-monooxygenase
MVAVVISTFSILVSNMLNCMLLCTLQISPGVYEGVTLEHSWDSPHRLTNMALFKLQRHADHHVNAGKRYQVSYSTVQRHFV